MREWLIAERKKTEKSQYQVAEEAGMAQSTYASYETGARNPSVSVAKRIAAVLGFDWTRFFDDEKTA